VSRHEKTSKLIEMAAETLRQHHPMTVRQVYYRLVSQQVIENTRSSYQSVSKALVAARRPVSAGKYVLTAAIRQAVAGREAEVLAALGIDRQAGRPHITCPYPPHADGNPSWRWDPRKARAFRLRIEKSRSIFDVAMSREEIGFDGAKLHVAQILACEDLIKGENQGRYQATDVASLLSPAPDNRDDDPVFRYLGARPGIDPAEVSAPSTRGVGVKLLAYFDPPPGVRRKPKLIGFWRRAVFETAAVSRRHARIYLARNAQGKADLGTGGTHRDLFTARRHARPAASHRAYGGLVGDRSRP
jgi:hypothetical protein